jgi:hypothetical protein
MSGQAVRDLRRAARSGDARGCSSMAEHQLPKLTVRVRFPSPAPHEPRSEDLRRESAGVRPPVEVDGPLDSRSVVVGLPKLTVRSSGPLPQRMPASDLGGPVTSAPFASSATAASTRMRLAEMWSACGGARPVHPSAGRRRLRGGCALGVILRARHKSENGGTDVVPNSPI